MHFAKCTFNSPGKFLLRIIVRDAFSYLRTDTSVAQRPLCFTVAKSLVLFKTSVDGPQCLRAYSTVLSSPMWAKARLSAV